MAYPTYFAKPGIQTHQECAVEGAAHHCRVLRLSGIIPDANASADNIEGALQHDEAAQLTGLQAIRTRSEDLPPGGQCLKADKDYHTLGINTGGLVTATGINHQVVALILCLRASNTP